MRLGGTQANILFYFLQNAFQSIAWPRFKGQFGSATVGLTSLSFLSWNTLPVQLKFYLCQLCFCPKVSFLLDVNIVIKNIPCICFACGNSKIYLFSYSHGMTSLGIYSVQVFSFLQNTNYTKPTSLFFKISYLLLF